MLWGRAGNFPFILGSLRLLGQDEKASDATGFIPMVMGDARARSAREYDLLPLKGENDAV